MPVCTGSLPDEENDMAMSTAYSGKSDTGLRRSRNEDCFIADPELGLYVICDGMGGVNAGDVASRMAIDSILAHVKAADYDSAVPLLGPVDSNLTPTTNRLASAIRAANEAVHTASLTDTKLEGMGTTVVAARLSNQGLSIAHVGDSRLYLVRDGVVQLLTIDHSWVAEQVAQGNLTEEEAERSSRRNIVTRALGVESSVEVDLAEIPMFNDDQVLLCSDGLTRGVGSREILETLNLEIDLHRKTQHLITLANRAGGHDNITVLLIEIQQAAIGRFWQRIRRGWFLKAS